MRGAAVTLTGSLLIDKQLAESLTTDIGKLAVLSMGVVEMLDGL